MITATFVYCYMNIKNFPVSQVKLPRQQRQQAGPVVKGIYKLTGCVCKHTEGNFSRLTVHQVDPSGKEDFLHYFDYHLVLVIVV